MNIPKIWLVVLFIVPIFSTQAEIYKWVDEKGKIHYSDEKPEGQQVLEEEIDIKNRQLQFMDEEDERLLQSFDKERKEREKDLSKSEIQGETKEIVEPSGLDSYRCFEPSPAVTPSGISHLEVNPRELSDSQIDLLEHIFADAEGSWRGGSEGFSCFGTQEIPEKRVELYLVRAEGEVGVSTAFRLRAELDAPNLGRHKRDTYRFYIVDEMLRLGTPGLAGDVELSHLTEHGFRIYQKQWRRARAGGQILVENLIQFTLHNDHLYVERASFHQGVLGDMRVLDLERY